MSGFRRRYGASPLHLLALVGCLALAAAAVVPLREGSQPLRITLWFVGAVLVHDLLLYPLTMLADRSVGAALHRRSAPPGSINWVRVPAVLSLTLLLVFWPAITRHSAGSYAYASGGLSQDVFLPRFLLLTAALFLGSALLFAATRSRRRA